MVKQAQKKCHFEIRQIEDWDDPESGWIWNTSYHLGEFAVLDSANEKRAFLNALHKLGITLARGAYVVVCDGNIYEVQDRKTGEPILAAIPME